MFNNIGEKIKKVAKILFWIEAVIFVLAAFVYAGQALQDTSSFIVFLLVLVIGTVLGILISYVSVIEKDDAETLKKEYPIPIQFLHN